MKSKNLVSLTVAAVYVVLAITGLLIYLGQGNYFSAKHIHAWFGILFFVAATFHIVNNWSSIKNYSVNRKEGSFRKELIFPLLITLVFAGGIAADLPVFKDLANAGKRAFGPEKKKERRLSQQAVDSVTQKFLTEYTLAVSQNDTAQLARMTSPSALIDSQSGHFMAETMVANTINQEKPAAAMLIQLHRASALDEHVIVAAGTAKTRLSDATSARFTVALIETEDHWRIAALQVAKQPAPVAKVAVR